MLTVGQQRFLEILSTAVAVAIIHYFGGLALFCVLCALFACWICSSWSRWNPRAQPLSRGFVLVGLATAALCAYLNVYGEEARDLMALACACGALFLWATWFVKRARISCSDLMLSAKRRHMILFAAGLCVAPSWIILTFEPNVSIRYNAHPMETARYALPLFMSYVTLSIGAPLIGLALTPRRRLFGHRRREWRG